MQRSALLKALKAVKPGIANKDIIESMTYFFLSGKHVISYNDKISIQHPLKTDFTSFVKADDLLRVVEKCSATDMDLIAKDEVLNVKAKRLNVKLATIDDPEFLKRIDLITKSLKKAVWMTLPNNFMDSVELCSYVAASMESEYTLSCVKIEGTDCIASDNQRIAMANLESPMELMYLKATEIKNLTSTQPTYYYISKAWVHFKNEDGCIFSIRKVKGLFPDFTHFAKFKGTKIQLPKAMLEGTDIASIFSDDEKPNVDITIKGGKCLVSVKSVGGSSHHKSSIKYKGPEIKFSINPDFLREMMNHSTKIIISEDKCRLTTENFTLITSLTAD